MENRIYTLLMFLGYILKIILILIPILIILFGTIDLVKYMINQGDNKSIKIFTKRLVMGISVFFVTTIVFFLLNLLGENVNNTYLKCFTDPKLCNEIIENMRNSISSCSNIDNKNECCKFILNNNKASYNYDIDDCSIPISSLINK